MPTWIKFCGTTCLEDALASIEAGADALGFIFAPSKRQVTIPRAKEVTARLPAHIEKIGVFLDTPVREIRKTVAETGLTGIQLHSNRTQIEDYDSLRMGGPKSLRVVRTILVNEDFVASLDVAAHVNNIDAWLLDSGTGSGKTFDWRAVGEQLSDRSARFIIAGGLNPANVAQAIKIFSPWGVDVVSGIESEPGRKDLQKMRAFVAAVRKAEQK